MILPPGLTLQSWEHWPIALLAACAAPLAWWHYLARDRETTLARWWLPASLRVVAVVLVALAAVQPTVSTPNAGPARPRLVILVDDSLSMGTVDGSLSVAERVRVAEGIGLLPGGVRIDVVAPLRAALDELRGQLELIDELQEEIDYAQLVGRDTAAQETRLASLAGEFAEGIARLTELAERDARLRRAAERLRSMPVVEPERVERASRGLELVEQSLRAIADDADAELAARDPRVSDAVARVATSSRLQLASMAIEQPERGLRARLSSRFDVECRTLSGADWTPATSPAGSTDLHAALARVRGETGPGLAGVLVLSDGRQTESSAPTASATPTWAVRIGSAAARRDPSLAQVILAESSLPGQPLLVRGVVQLVSARDETATLRVSHAERVATRTVRVPANSRQVTIELSLPAPTTGTGPSPVVVELEAGGDDATRENNRAVFPLERRAPVEVLLVGPLARRDARCLDAWLDQPAYRVRRVQASAAEGRQVEIDPASLRAASTLILVDRRPDDLATESWGRIEEAVRREGLTVVLFCGDPTLLRELGRAEATRWLIPVEPPEAIGWRTWSGESAGFRVMADREHGERAMIDLETEQSRRRWLATPRFFRHLALPSLPADGQAWLREVDSQAPLLASWRHGLGEVRWLGLIETWRWRRTDAPEDVQSSLFRAVVDPRAGRVAGDVTIARAHLAENARLRELADLGADPGGLSRLVRSGPGAAISLAELPSLVDRLLAEPPPNRSRRDVPLWSSWSWLGLCVGALTLEWSLRKRMGLV